MATLNSVYFVRNHRQESGVDKQVFIRNGLVNLNELKSKISLNGIVYAWWKRVSYIYSSHFMLYRVEIQLIGCIMCPT